MHIKGLEEIYKNIEPESIKNIVNEYDSPLSIFHIFSSVVSLYL